MPDQGAGRPEAPAARSVSPGSIAAGAVSPGSGAAGSMTEGSIDRAERRYRRLLRAYPPAWRRRHGDALLGVLLDVAQARGSGPTVREAVDLVLQGGRVRAAFLVPQPGTRRLAAVVALVLGTAVAVTDLALAEVVFAPGPSADGVVAAGRLGPFASPSALLYLCWLLGFLLVLLGRGRWARPVLAACAPVGVGVLLAAAQGIGSPVVVPVLSLAATGPVAALAELRPSRARRLGLLAVTGVLADALVLRAWQLLSADLGWARGAAPVSSANDFGIQLQLILWRELLSGILVGLVVAAALTRRRSHWFPAGLLAAVAWTAPVFGPAGLLLLGFSEVVGWLGTPPEDVGAQSWLTSIAACLALTVLASVRRWHRGPIPGRVSPG